MNLTPLEQINNLAGQKQTPQSQEALRRTAQQFEAILLMQLTSALSRTGAEDDENALFGGDGGSNLAKQMFSEQLATTMAQSGGIGLSDLILQQFGINQPKTLSGTTNNLAKSISAVKDIKESVSAEKNLPTKTSSLIDKSAKIVPVTNNAAVKSNPEEVEIISTFEDQIKTEGIDDSLKNLMLDGKILNSTRPRVVPGEPITEIKTSILPGAVLPAKTINYQLPLAGRISSDFGNRFHPIEKRMKFHGGIDIAVPKGTPVGAAAEGVVIFAGWRGGYGNLVVIRHPDGKETSYAHLDKIFVTEGDKVTVGQKIAASGSTGKSTGPHLHFEVRENGQLVNPSKILSNVLPGTTDR